MHAGTQHGCHRERPSFDCAIKTWPILMAAMLGTSICILFISCLSASLHQSKTLHLWKTNGFCCTCRICHCSTSPTSCGRMHPFCMTCRTCCLPSQVRSWSAVTRSSSTHSSSPTCCGPSAFYRYALFGLGSFAKGPGPLAFAPGLFVHCPWTDSL